MRERLKTLKPWLVSAALLFLPPSEGRATSPNSDSSGVEAAVGFAEDLAAGRAIGALLRLYPDLSNENSLRGSARLTPKNYDTLIELRSVIPSFKGCRVSEGMVDGSLVRLIFDRPCGDKEAYGVDVRITSTGGEPHPTGEFTLHTNEGD